MTQKQGFWITCALAIVWLVYFFGPVLVHPDDYWLGGAGDGAKNYFAFAYHVKHDATWLHFEGCNYPTGDHVTFTDGHPILSLLIGWMPWVKMYPVGAMNVFMLVGLWLSWQLIYWVLVRWGCTPWFAVAATCVVALGQPQLERLTGHFSLAAAWVIPLAILLLERWRSSQRLVFLIGGAVLQIGIWLLHPYLGLMVTGMMIMYPLFVRWISPQEGRGAWWSALFSMAVMLGYLVWVKMTDVVAERPDGGKGFFDYLTSLKLLFGGLDGNLMEQWFGKVPQEAGSGEGKAYVGVATMCSLLCVLICVLRKQVLVLLHWRGILPWLAMGIIFFAFAAGIPFIWGWEEGVHQIPYLEHFRSPGRFVWVFHFVLVMGSLALAFHCIKEKRKLAMAFAVTIIAIASVDHFAHQLLIRKIARSTPNYFDARFMSEKDARVIADIQNSEEPFAALWTIPQLCYGSDVYTRYFDRESVMHAYIVAYHTGLPVLGNFNPRSGLNDARMTMQMTAPNVFEKELWSRLSPATCFYLLPLDQPKFDGEERLAQRNSPRICIAEEREEWEKFKALSSAGPTAELWLDSALHEDAAGHLVMKADRYHGVATIHTDTLREDVRVQISAWVAFLNAECPSVVWGVDEIEPSGEKHEVLRQYTNEVSYQFRQKAWLNAFFTMRPNKEYLVYLECPKENQLNVRFYDFLLHRITQEGGIEGNYQSLWRELGYARAQ